MSTLTALAPPTDSESARRWRRVGGAFCLVAAPAAVLVSSSTFPDGGAFSFAMMRLGFMLFFGAILTLYGMLAPAAGRTALVGAALAMGGLATGVALSTANHYEWYLRGGGVDAQIAGLIESALDQSGLYLFQVFLPVHGFAFPIGMLVLAIGLFMCRTVPRPVALLIGLAALLFPLGRVPMFQPVMVASDAAYLLAFGALAYRRIWGSPAAAEAVSPAAMEGASQGAQ